MAGQKYAICIGIDQYGGENQLSGCVNDANSWASFFQNAGFQTRQLLDGDATRNGIIGGIQLVIGKARSGDVVAIQYSGHGTSLPDQNGDEEDGNDEAIVPIDFAASDVIVDDDIGPLLDQAAPGVAINALFDCCFSGGGTRLLASSNVVPKLRSQSKVRYMPPTEAMIARHRVQMKQRGTRGLLATDTRMREVLFAACQPSEKSREMNGHGLFTAAALSVLQHGFSGLTNTTFIQNTVAALGSSRPQTPQLACAPGMENNSLFSFSKIPSPMAQFGQGSDTASVLAALQAMSGDQAPVAPTVPSAASIDDVIAGLNAIASVGRALKRSN